MKIAIIPARGGSKRIPQKNIKLFNGKPIIAWSIETAKLSGLFDYIIVSTDDFEISEIAIYYGADVPFMRPPELSNDYVATREVISHATRWVLDQGHKLDAVCCIYPTAPFIQIDDLKLGLSTLNSGEWSYTFSATNYAAPIFRAFRKLPDGGAEMIYPEKFSARSQDLPQVFHDAGQFYWGRPASWLEAKPIFSNKSVPILIPRWRVQDIDSQDDWLRAELIYDQLKTKGLIKNEEF